MGFFVFDLEVDVVCFGLKFFEELVKFIVGLVVYIGVCGWSEGILDFVVRIVSNGGDGGCYCFVDFLDFDYFYLYEIFFGFVVNFG